MQSRSRRAGAVALPTLATFAVCGTAGAQCPEARPPGAPPELVRMLLACPAPAPAPPSDVTLALARSVRVHASVGGPVVRRLGARTEFGSAVRLPVFRRRGAWLGVVSTTLPNGRLAWVHESAAVRLVRRRALHLVVRRSRGVLSVLDGGRLVRRVTVGVGTPASPTPVGRFAVTDKLDGRAYSPVYGCCILALSGHQTRLPAGWRGGDRLAIHGGPAGASSAGCLHASERALRWLMRRVPLGTVVTVRR